MSTRLVAASKGLMTEAWDPSSWWTTVRPLLTPTNFVAAVKFLLVLLLAAFTGLIAGGKQVANWSLKAIHELAFLVDRSTPFALGALNMLSKVVGGFYVLLAMIWRDVRKPKPPPSAVPPSLQGPSPSLPAPRPIQHIPNQVRQRPPSAHAAMDTMYSQGRPWWSGQSSCHLDVIKMWYYVVALLVYQKFRTHATICHHPFSPSFKTVPLSPPNEICVFFWTVLPNHSKLWHRAMLLHKQISSVIKKSFKF
jgi:hypothetical protein